MVLAFAYLYDNLRSLWAMGIKTSIIICSYKREKALKRCLKSLKEQTVKYNELIICTEKGNLVELKDKGWRNAKGDILIWIDDDVVCSPYWLENIVSTFENNSLVIGVTGPTIVPDEYKKNRDVFKEGWFKYFYNWFFLEGKMYLPGKISRWGVNTLGANYLTPHIRNIQIVDFLEPSQFAIRRWALESEGGFNLRYSGVAEWCDVDLCYRIKNYGLLVFNPLVTVYHYPIKDKTTDKRLDTRSRYENYCRFANTYVARSLRNKLYRLFLRIYFFAKERRWI